MADIDQLRPAGIEIADGDTAKTPEINCTITEGTISSDVLPFTIQFYHWEDEVTRAQSCLVWMATTDGGAASASGNTIIDAGSGSITHELTANAILLCTTDATGELVLSCEVSGTATRYVHVQLPDGSVESCLLTWAA